MICRRRCKSGQRALALVIYAKRKNKVHCALVGAGLGPRRIGTGNAVGSIVGVSDGWELGHALVHSILVLRGVSDSIIKLKVSSE